MPPSKMSPSGHTPRPLFRTKAGGHIIEPPILEADFLYLKLIGDLSIQEQDFGRIQIDRIVDTQKWVDSIKPVEEEHVRLAIVTANNHYDDFGRGTVNIFRKSRRPNGKKREREVRLKNT